MKIAIITDTHWGIRNDSPIFIKNTKKFLDDIFFPTLKSESINRVFHLGDLVDRRKYINFVTANSLRNDFLDVLEKNNIQTDIITGNHDTYYKNTNSINCLDELILGKYHNINIHNSPKEIEINNTKILLLPWICDDNRQKVFDVISKTTSKICMSHLELIGFQMYKGHLATEGDDPKKFDKFNFVFSGHYHHKSYTNNIYYLGSHGEFIWSDYDDPRGFHIFDLETKELQFIQNPYKIFKKIWYDENEKNKKDLGDLSSSIIKVIVKNKQNPYEFDKFMESIEKNNPYELQTVEDHLNLNIEEDSDIVNEAESTIDIFKKYIDKSEIPNINKKQLENMLVQIYNEALSVE
jgi:DNA repair exonuclease SbcCD nuclease subunit